MQMYPQLSSGAGESSQWRAAEKDNKRHPCRRDCADNQPMTCYYYMVVHYDDTMAETCKRYLQVPVLKEPFLKKNISILLLMCLKVCSEKITLDF